MTLNRAKAKGRKNNKEANLLANKGHRKTKAYGSKKKKAYDSQDEEVRVVNKSAERAKNKLNINKIDDDEN